MMQEDVLPYPVLLCQDAPLFNHLIHQATQKDELVKPREGTSTQPDGEPVDLETAQAWALMTTCK